MTEQNHSMQSNITPPPTTAGVVRLRREVSTWVKPIGIIAIVFGAGALCMNLLGIAAQFLTSTLAASANADISNAFAGQEKLLPWIMTASGLRMITDIMLVVTGALLLNRNPKGAQLSKLWGASKIFVVMIGCWVGFLAAQIQMEAANKNTQLSAMPMGGKYYEIGVLAGIVMSALWGCALPVFMLVWFSRSKIKTEVANWTTGSQSTGINNAL